MSALDQLYDRLLRMRPFDLKLDILHKLISNTVSCLKDNNAKLVLICLDCIKLFLELHNKDFGPLVNMTFDMLILKCLYFNNIFYNLIIKFQN